MQPRSRRSCPRRRPSLKLGTDSSGSTSRTLGPDDARTRRRYRSVASLQRDLATCRSCIEAGHRLESLPVGVPARDSVRTCSVRRRHRRRRRAATRGAAAPVRRCAAGSSLDEAAFYATFYCASVTRCYPGRGPLRARRPHTDSERAPALPDGARTSSALLRPKLIVTVGGLAARDSSAWNGSRGSSGRATTSPTRPSSRCRIRRERAAG